MSMDAEERLTNENRVPNVIIVNNRRLINFEIVK